MVGRRLGNCESMHLSIFGLYNKKESEFVQNIHCIGDRANKVVLDIYERLLTKSGYSVTTESETRRPRIEHAQIMTLDDLQRTGNLGGTLSHNLLINTLVTYLCCIFLPVIASVQPTHA